MFREYYDRKFRGYGRFYVRYYGGFVAMMVVIITIIAGVIILESRDGGRFERSYRRCLKQGEEISLTWYKCMRYDSDGDTRFPDKVIRRKLLDRAMRFNPD